MSMFREFMRLFEKIVEPGFLRKVVHFSKVSCHLFYLLEWKVSTNHSVRRGFSRCWPAIAKHWEHVPCERCSSAIMSLKRCFGLFGQWSHDVHLFWNWVQENRIQTVSRETRLWLHPRTADHSKVYEGQYNTNKEERCPRVYFLTLWKWSGKRSFLGLSCVKYLCSLTTS